MTGSVASLTWPLGSEATVVPPSILSPEQGAGKSEVTKNMQQPFEIWFCGEN